jgi:hypothetical protein
LKAPEPTVKFMCSKASKLVNRGPMCKKHGTNSGYWRQHDFEKAKKSPATLHKSSPARLSNFKHEMTDQIQMERRRRRPTSLHAKCTEIQN